MTSDGGQRRADTARSAEEESTNRFRADDAMDTDRLTLSAYTAAIDEGWTECEAQTVYESEYLTITGASAEHIPAMKLEAGRRTDIGDVATLIGHLGITTAEEALAIHGRLFPESTRGSNASEIVEHVLAGGNSGRQGPG